MGLEDKYKGRYNPNSNRLKYHDYGTQGGYFITICTKQREKYFGEIKDGKMKLSELGEVATQCYCEIPKHFPFVTLDEFIVMPNHIHGIIFIHKPSVETKNFSSGIPAHSSISVETKNFSSGIPAHSSISVETKNFSLQGILNGTGKTIGSIVRGLKIGVTKYAREKMITYQVWQPNYYDRIIRDDNELQKIRAYILENPANWEFDEENA